MGAVALLMYAHGEPKRLLWLPLQFRRRFSWPYPHGHEGHIWAKVGWVASVRAWTYL